VGCRELVSTADDLDRFYAGLLTGALLRPAELKQMLTITDNEHSGLGIERVLLPSGVILWGHFGGISVTSPVATTPPMPAAR
jgi:D-alanyl-D-alanine carboxypeptidase